MYSCKFACFNNDKPDAAKSIDDKSNADAEPIDDQPVVTANDAMVPVTDLSRLQYLPSPRGG